MGERLNRVRNGKIEYERLMARVAELEALATRITPVLSDMPKGGTSMTDDKWAKLIDYKQQLLERIGQYLTDCVELEKELECIRSQRIRTAMLYRYIDCMNVEAIADALDTDLRYTYKLLSKGRKIYDERYSD